MERDKRNYGEASGGGDEASDDGRRFEGEIEEVKRGAETLKNGEEERERRREDGKAGE